MGKYAVFVFSDPETKDGLGRVVNAMEMVKELDEKGHDVKLFFDGYGTGWPIKLSNKEHVAHDLFMSTKRNIDGACLFCSTVFSTKDGINQCSIELVNEYDQHISTGNLISEGYQIINF